MLRMTAEARKVVTDAKAAGVRLYATPQYAEFLMGHTHNPGHYGFTTAHGLDVLKPRDGDVFDPTITCHVAIEGLPPFVEGFYFNRTPDEVITKVRAQYSSDKPFTITDYRTGLVLAKYEPPKTILDVWLNGFQISNVTVYSTDTKEQREEKVRVAAMRCTYDRLQFGNEAPYFVDPDAAHPVWYRKKGQNKAVYNTISAVKNPTLEMPTRLTEPGEYEWSYLQKDPVWTRFTVNPKTQTHFTLYSRGTAGPCVKFEAPFGVDDATLYSLAAEALRKAGHSPSIAVGGKVLS